MNDRNVMRLTCAMHEMMDGYPVAMRAAAVTMLIGDLAQQAPDRDEFLRFVTELAGDFAQVLDIEERAMAGVH